MEAAHLCLTKLANNIGPGGARYHQVKTTVNIVPSITGGKTPGIARWEPSRTLWPYQRQTSVGF